MVVVARLSEVTASELDDVVVAAAAGALGVGHIDRSVDGGRVLGINGGDLAEVGERHGEIFGRGLSRRLLYYGC